LKLLQEEFSWLYNATELRRNPEGIDPAFCVAIFGIGVLAGIHMYEAFNEIFQLATAGWAVFFVVALVAVAVVVEVEAKFDEPYRRR
jgi:hypothetical protein